MFSRSESPVGLLLERKLDISRDAPGQVRVAYQVNSMLKRKIFYNEVSSATREHGKSINNVKKIINRTDCHLCFDRCNQRLCLLDNFGPAEYKNAAGIYPSGIVEGLFK